MSNDANDELLTLQEAAAKLRVSDETLRRALKRGGGQLRGVRVGNVWRVFASSLRALLAGADMQVRASDVMALGTGGRE